MLPPAPPFYNNQKILEAEAERMRLRSRRSYPIAFRTPSSRPVSVHTAAPVRLGMMSLILGRPKTLLGAPPCAM